MAAPSMRSSPQNDVCVVNFSFARLQPRPYPDAKRNPSHSPNPNPNPIPNPLRGSRSARAAGAVLPHRANEFYVRICLNNLARLYVRVQAGSD